MEGSLLFSMFFSLCFVFLVLAWYGSQSEAAVNCLRQPVFPLWVVGSYFMFIFCLVCSAPDGAVSVSNTI